MVTTRIKRARDVEEGTFVRVLDDVPNSELTIGDEGIVVDRPEGKFLLTEELDEALPLNSQTPLEIVSAVREQAPTPMPVPMAPPRTEQIDFGTPTTEPIEEPPSPVRPQPTQEVDELFGVEERRPLDAEEAGELEELTEMDQNGEDMDEEEVTRFQSLGERVRRFGVSAGQALGGAVELGAAVGRPAARGVVRGVQALQQPETRARIRRGLITGAEFAAERAEVPLAAAELGFRGVARAETAAARAIRQITGQQVRLSRVPAGTLVRFDEDRPESDIFRGDEGVVQFGIRRRQRRVFFPSTGETVLADPNMLVTVLGQRRVSETDRAQTARRILQSPRTSQDVEQQFFAPRRPAGVTPAPETFRPQLRARPPVEQEFMEPPVSEADRFRVILGF